MTTQCHQRKFPLRLPPLRVVSASFTCLPTPLTGPLEQLHTDTECSGGLGSASRLSPGLGLHAEASGAVRTLVPHETRLHRAGAGRGDRVFHSEGFITNHSGPVLESGICLGWGELGVEKYANCIPPGPSGYTCAITCCSSVPLPGSLKRGIEPCPSLHMPPNTENGLGYSSESKNGQENCPLHDFFHSDFFFLIEGGDSKRGSPRNRQRAREGHSYQHDNNNG